MTNRISSFVWLLYSQLVYKLCMHSFGARSRIIAPILLRNQSHISIGRNVLIRNGVRLEVVDPQNAVVIRIGNNVNIEQNVHIVGRCGVVIGDNVSITGCCSIVDVTHPYADIRDSRKIGDRIGSISRPVSVGDNSFIGFGTHVAPGVCIGKYCVIGANSVVTSNIPDYCVAAGVPARVIKRYCPIRGAWLRIGDF